MSSPVVVDIFVEDRAHEAFLIPMLKRIAQEENIGVLPRVRSARGGHGRAMEELSLYQNVVSKGVAGTTRPDILIVGIDGNCRTFTRAREEIKAAIKAPFSGALATACPDPHIERWYLADPDSFKAVVGHRPAVGKKKCARDYYKNVLANAVRQAGHLATLGGIEFAPELVEDMDLYRAGRNDRSLKTFLDDLRRGLRLFQQEVVSESE